MSTPTTERRSTQVFTTTEKAVAFIEALFVPGFNMKMKYSSWHQRLIGHLLGLVGNGAYMTQFWTTIGYTVYRPDLAGMSNDEWKVMWHEGRHALQAKSLTRVLMGFLYLLPLSLVPLVAIGAIFSLWWLVPTALLLLPLPAYFRMRLEMQAYRTSMVADYASSPTGHIFRTTAAAQFMVDHFTGPNYYYMWPFRKDVQRRLMSAVDYVTGPIAEMDDYDQALVAWVKENVR